MALPMHSANHPANHPGAWWADVKVALALLTRLPMGPRGDAEAPDIARAGRVMPLAGALIGLVGAAAFWLSGGLGLPPLVSGLVAVAATILFTGAFHEDGLADRSGAETTLDLWMAVVGPIVLMEMVRRVAGVPLFLVTIGFVVYTYWGDLVLVLLGVALAIELTRRFIGPRAALGLAAAVLLSLLLPGVRALLDYTAYPFQGATHERMAAYLWLTSEGTLGTIAAIMSEFIFIFILFAALLEATGTGQILINLAFALTGRFRGGPAQAAVRRFGRGSGPPR
ncbi:MAG: adenosylcobinamide-GDP ribazoletransferase [Proteobacteria bacterium]|nr:adenosylcobinamide-GDP ribazoletransferase [Pseudomonadota bacterium]